MVRDCTRPAHLGGDAIRALEAWVKLLALAELDELARVACGIQHQAAAHCRAIFTMHAGHALPMLRPFHNACVKGDSCMPGKHETHPVHLVCSQKPKNQSCKAMLDCLLSLRVNVLEMDQILLKSHQPNSGTDIAAGLIANAQLWTSQSRQDQVT